MTDEPVNSMALPPLPNLAAALAAVQAAIPPVAKTKTAKVKGTTKGGVQFDYSYKYADLADVTAAILPELGKHGLAFTCLPTLGSEGRFALAYRLIHESGESIGGFYPLDPSMTPQQIGGHITYARRYCLCAVTGIAAEEDTDAREAETSAQKRGTGQRDKPPIRPFDELPRNQDGCLSRSKCTNEELAHYGAMTDQQQRQHNKLERDVLGVNSEGKVKHPVGEHLTATPDDDRFYDTPPVLVRTPQAAPNPAGAIHAYFKRLGSTTEAGAYTDQERYGAMTTITGRPIHSTNDLTAAEGLEVKRFLAGCRDGDVLVERLAAKATEENGNG